MGVYVPHSNFFNATVPYLGVRAQFGDASQLKSSQDIAGMITGVARLAVAGERDAREACNFMSAEQWAAIRNHSPSPTTRSQACC